MHPQTSLNLLYLFLLSTRAPGARRRRQLESEEEEGHNMRGYNSLNATTNSAAQVQASQTLENSTIEVPKKSYHVYNMTTKTSNVDMCSSADNGRGSILVSIYNNTNGRRTDGARAQDNVESLEMSYTKTQPEISERNASVLVKVGEQTSWSPSKQNRIISSPTNRENNFRAPSLPSFGTDRVDHLQSRSETSFQMNQSQQFNDNSLGLKDWSRIYLFGTGSKTDISPP